MPCRLANASGQQPAGFVFSIQSQPPCPLVGLLVLSDELSGEEGDADDAEEGDPGPSLKPLWATDASRGMSTIDL